MKKGLSIGTLILACLSLAAFVFVAVSYLPYAITKDSEGWGSMIFRCWLGPLLGGGILLFAVAPSAILFWKGGRQKRDRISLAISGVAFGLVALTWVLIEPLRHAIIFGR